MRLYLVQHGEALPETVDPERRLSERGRQDVTRLAGFLDRSAVRVRRVCHSGKARARETAECLAASMAPGLAIETVAGLAPNDPVEPLAEQIGRWTEDTLLVGHLPFMGRLVGYLVAGDRERPVAAFQPGSMVCLERDEQGRWSVAWMLRPELLGG